MRAFSPSAAAAVLLVAAAAAALQLTAAAPASARGRQETVSLRVDPRSGSSPMPVAVAADGSCPIPATAPIECQNITTPNALYCLAIVNNSTKVTELTLGGITQINNTLATQPPKSFTDTAWFSMPDKFFNTSAGPDPFMVQVQFWGKAGQYDYEFNLTTTASNIGYDASLTFYQKAFNPQPNMTSNPFISQFCIFDV